MQDPGALMKAILNKFNRAQQHPTPRLPISSFPRLRRATLLLVLLCLPLGHLQAAVREVGAIGLTVRDLDRELDFYTKVLSFEFVSRTASAAGADDNLYGLCNTE